MVVLIPPSHSAFQASASSLFPFRLLTAFHGVFVLLGVSFSIAVAFLGASSSASFSSSPSATPRLRRCFLRFLPKERCRARTFQTG